MQHNQRKFRAAVLFVAFACGSLAACGDSTVSTGTDTDTDGDTTGSDSDGAALDELYQQAIADAEIAEADEVVDTLVAIADSNAELIRDGGDRVLMVTWTSWDGYDGVVGQDTELGIDVWVTPAPTLQDFCASAGLTGADLGLRVEQLLGLPPHGGKDRVVELWVPATTMFRPSPDPEVDDSVAELDFPPGVDPAHVTWIEELTASSYGPDGYPWTRLGYTYDWHPDAPEIGLSEFVIRAGSTVGVEAVSGLDDYCAGG